MLFEIINNKPIYFKYVIYLTLFIYIILIPSLFLHTTTLSNIFQSNYIKFNSTSSFLSTYNRSAYNISTIKIIWLAEPSARRVFQSQYQSINIASQIIGLGDVEDKDYDKCNYDNTCIDTIDNIDKKSSNNITIIYIYANLCSDITVSGIKALPRKVIIWQLEPIVDRNLSCSYSEAGINRFNSSIIWDYSTLNIKYLYKLVPNAAYIRRIPLLWFPGITKDDYSIPLLPNVRNDEQIWDVIMFGYGDSERRQYIIAALRAAKLSVNIQMIFGDGRERHVGSAKVIINIHFGAKFTSHLEVHRLQYVLSNRCFVISETVDDLEVMNEYEGGVIFAPYDKLVETVLHWLKKSPAERHAIADHGYNILRKTTMTEVLVHKIHEAIDFYTK